MHRTLNLCLKKENKTMNKNKKLNKHFEAVKIAYELSKAAGSFGPMVLLITRNVYTYKSVRFRGTLASYIEFCHMNKIDVRVRWSEILG